MGALLGKNLAHIRADALEICPQPFSVGA